MEPPRIVIIGAGPTAMGCLHRLYQLRDSGTIPQFSISVVEQEHEVGGLARTITDPQGFSWDLGVHITGSSRYPEFLAAINAVIPTWRAVRRCAKADMTHAIGRDRPCGSSSQTSHYYSNYVRYQCKTFRARSLSMSLSEIPFQVPYPVQNSIPYFDEELKAKCLAELEVIEKQQETAMPIEDEHFGQFSERIFGPTLQSIFIRPYNEKVWTVPLEEMNTSWVEGRVPRIDPLLLRRRCRRPLEEVIQEDRANHAVFRYPAKCRGIGEMWKRFASKFPAEIIHLNEKVTAIDVNEKRVISESEGNNGKRRVYEYDTLISTMPITTLGRLTGLAPSLDLRHSTVILVGIGLDSAQVQLAKELSWAYYPTSSTIFYRCTVLSNFSSDVVPTFPAPTVGYWSLLCEIGVDAATPLYSCTEDSNRQTVVERVIEDLIAVGLIKSSEEVCSRWIKWLPFGYPIPTLTRNTVLQEAHNLFQQHSIFSRGRFGGWKYEISNQDHSFEAGLQLVDRIFLDIPETLYI